MQAGSSKSPASTQLTQQVAIPAPFPWHDPTRLGVQLREHCWPRSLAARGHGERALWGGSSPFLLHRTRSAVELGGAFPRVLTHGLTFHLSLKVVAQPRDLFLLFL